MFFISHASRKPLLISVAGLIVLIGGFFLFNSYIYEAKQADLEPVVIDSEPTNFAEIGNITIDNSGASVGVPVFVYEKPGRVALTRDLVFDILSVCMQRGSALPCLVMSQTFGDAFGGERVSVEGIETPEGVVVRKVRIISEDIPPVSVQTGSTFIGWPQAISIIEHCQAASVMQTHALDVYLTLHDGTEVRAVEPNIDEVFRVLETVKGSCPVISVATE